MHVFPHIQTIREQDVIDIHRAGGCPPVVTFEAHGGLCGNQSITVYVHICGLSVTKLTMQTHFTEVQLRELFTLVH